MCHRRRVEERDAKPPNAGCANKASIASWGRRSSLKEALFAQRQNHEAAAVSHEGLVQAQRARQNLDQPPLRRLQPGAD